MSKFLKSLVIGTATGLATAYFLGTEKGKELKARAEKAYEAYKENPEEYHQMAKDKSNEYSHLAKDTFNSYKQKFETGEITPEQVFETVKEKTSQFVQKTSQQFAEEPEDDYTESSDVNLSEEDVIIDYEAIQEAGENSEMTETIPVITELDPETSSDLGEDGLQAAQTPEFSEDHSESNF